LTDDCVTESLLVEGICLKLLVSRYLELLGLIAQEQLLLAGEHGLEEVHGYLVEGWDHELSRVAQYVVEVALRPDVLAQVLCEHPGGAVLRMLALGRHSGHKLRVWPPCLQRRDVVLARVLVADRVGPWLLGGD
jgi:hypothetical protein